MKNIYDLLRQKELEIERARYELEALQIAARLLADDTDAEAPTVSSDVTAEAPAAETVKPAPAVVAPLVRHDFRELPAYAVPVAASRGTTTPLGWERRRVSRCNIVDVHVVPVFAFQNAALLLDLDGAVVVARAAVADGEAFDTRSSWSD